MEANPGDTACDKVSNDNSNPHRRKMHVSPLFDKDLSRNAKLYLILKTFFLALVWINMGFSMSVQFVTVPDMLPRIGANYETLMRSFTFGSFAGAAGHGMAIICDRFRKWSDLVMALSLLVSSISYVLLPWMRSVESFGFVNCVYYLGIGLQNAVGNYVMANMWGEYASGPLHLMHLGFGIGAFISPLIASPYLSADVAIKPNVSSTNDSTQFVTPTAQEDNATSGYGSRIEIPYAIIGGYGGCCMVMFIALQVIGRPRGLNLELDQVQDKMSEERCLDFFSPRNWADGNLVFGLTMLVGTMAYYIGLTGNESALRFFLFSFAIEGQFKFPKHEAALLQSMYSLSYTIGRILSGVLSIIFPVQIIIFIEVAGVVVSTLCLSFFLLSKTHMWVFACLYGFMAGGNWPAGFSWFNRYISVTASFSAWIGVVVHIIKFGLDWIGGHLFQDNPVYVMYYSFGFAIFVLLNMCIIQVIAGRHGEKYSLRNQLPTDTEIELES